MYVSCFDSEEKSVNPVNSLAFYLPVSVSLFFCPVVWLPGRNKKLLCIYLLVLIWKCPEQRNSTCLSIWQSVQLCLHITCAELSDSQDPVRSASLSIMHSRENIQFPVSHCMSNVAEETCTGYGINVYDPQNEFYSVAFIKCKLYRLCRWSLESLGHASNIQTNRLLVNFCSRCFCFYLSIYF